MQIEMMDFDASIFNEGIRSLDIVIGGVVPGLDQIIGSAGRLRMTSIFGLAVWILVALLAPALRLIPFRFAGRGHAAA